MRKSANVYENVVGTCNHNITSVLYLWCRWLICVRTPQPGTIFIISTKYKYVLIRFSTYILVNYKVIHMDWWMDIFLINLAAGRGCKWNFMTDIVGILDNYITVSSVSALWPLALILNNIYLSLFTFSSFILLILWFQKWNEKSRWVSNRI